jgi:hypothetical protein
MHGLAIYESYRLALLLSVPSSSLYDSGAAASIKKID